MRVAIKYLITFLGTMLVRLARFIPNNDPVMGAAITLVRNGKWWHAPLYAGASMLLFDIITGRLGPWTLATTLTYAVVVLCMRRTLSGTYASYLAHGAVGILVFDFVTGPIMTSMFFDIPFAHALAGQVPFTLLHLATGMAYTAVLVPLLDPNVLANKAPWRLAYAQ